VDPLALALVLGSAFLHALWNTLLKREGDPESATVAAVTACAGFAILAALVLGSSIPRGPALFWAVISGLCEAGYVATLAFALTRAPLGPVYTISRGGSLLVVWPISVLLLGEPITVLAVCGTLAVALGLASTGLGAPQAEVGRQSVVPGLLWAAVCAVFVAGYHLAYKRALASGGVPAGVFALSLGLAMPLNLFRRGLGPAKSTLALFGKRPAPLLLAGAMAAASFLTLLYALERQGAGAVVTLRNTSILFAQGMAWAIGERPRRAQLAGAGLVAAGAVLLGWPR
jgi:drug/metabolite transporter (DMT)-like permease